MTTPRARLDAALGGRYLIERELGHGGMAVVYLAHDVRHDRKVAIKVLRPELAAALGPERFLREITIAAQLHHPHILPLYDSGEAAGFLYYVMPFVEGESLRDRLERETQLPLDDALQITREVADALSYAHSRDVVHRDIKPENILLESGHAIVADFGIARAITAAGGEKLTETGLAVGTPAYMSPEQASGDHRLDGRSDIYSLGCVAYEMLAGEPPYTGPTAQAIMARRLTDPVPRLRTVRETVPSGVEQAIVKTLAKVPADRFATASQFAEALARPSAPSRRVVKWTRFKWAVATLVVIVVGGAVWLRTRPRRSPVVPAASVIAVLPPAPVTPDTALARLGQNLVVTLGANLNGVGDLRAIDALTVLAQTQGRTADYTLDEAAALGRRLGASGVVSGTLTRDGPNVRLDLGLYATADAAPVARAFVTASGDDINALTDSATWALLRQVWRSGAPPSPSLAALTTRSVPALREFLEGERAIVEGRWQDAEQAFARAVQEDPTFWLAHWRYAYTKGWQLEEPDSASLAVASAHLNDLPERERLLTTVWQAPATLEHFDDARHLTERFPDYWPGWLEYADRLFHTGPLLGHELRESRPAFERLLQLNPRLVPAWEHLQGVGLVLEDTSLLMTALSRMDSLTTEDARTIANPFGLGFRMILQLMRGGPFEGPLADSVLNQALAFRDAGSQSWSSLWFTTAVQVEFSRRVLRRGALPQAAAFHRKGLALAWAGRGNWDSALTAIDGYAERARTDLSGLTPDDIVNTDASPDLALLDRYRIAVIGAWLGALDPGLAAERRPAAVEAVPRILSPRRDAELLWLDGVLAASRGDMDGIESARRQLAKGDTTWTSPFNRSLAAFALALAGHRREAGDSMAALSWEWWKWLGAPYFTGINRLAAARWLAAEGDLERAARLLPWHQSTIPIAAFAHGYAVLDGVSYLEMARVETMRGDRELAREYYQRFLKRYDAPSVRMRHLVDEARAALAR